MVLISLKHPRRIGMCWTWVNLSSRHFLCMRTWYHCLLLVVVELWKSVQPSNLDLGAGWNQVCRRSDHDNLSYIILVSCPTRWSLYRPLALCVYHLVSASFQQRDRVQQCTDIILTGIVALQKVTFECTDIPLNWHALTMHVNVRRKEKMIQNIINWPLCQKKIIERIKVSLKLSDLRSSSICWKPGPFWNVTIHPSNDWHFQHEWSPINSITILSLIL